MKRNIRISAVAGVALMIALGVLAGRVSHARSQARAKTQKSEAQPAGNAQRGKKIFTSYGCYECHGYEAQGAASTGPRLGPHPIPFSIFVKYIRHPSGQMPPYTSKLVPTSDLADMYAFLRSLPEPPPVKSIPLLNN